MWDLLLWVYIINAVLLINHEIDSAYWKEWELFGLPGGVDLFLLLHLPLVFLVLWGLLKVAQQNVLGLIMSLVMAGGGLFAFCIHAWFLRRGRAEFNSFISKAILAATLVASIGQIFITVQLF